MPAVDRKKWPICTACMLCLPDRRPGIGWNKGVSYRNKISSRPYQYFVTTPRAFLTASKRLGMLSAHASIRSWPISPHSLWGTVINSSLLIGFCYRCLCKPLSTYPRCGTRWVSVRRVLRQPRRGCRADYISNTPYMVTVM